MANYKEKTYVKILCVENISVGNPSVVNAMTENDNYPGDTLFCSSFNDSGCLMIIAGTS